MPLLIVTFKIDSELLSRVDTLAQEEGIPRSEFIRRALEWYTLELERKKKMGARIAGISTVKIRR